MEDKYFICKGFNLEIYANRCVLSLTDKAPDELIEYLRNTFPREGDVYYCTSVDIYTILIKGYKMVTLLKRHGYEIPNAIEEFFTEQLNNLKTILAIRVGYFADGRVKEARGGVFYLKCTLPIIHVNLSLVGEISFINGDDVYILIYADNYLKAPGPNYVKYITSFPPLNEFDINEGGASVRTSFSATACRIVTRGYIIKNPFNIEVGLDNLISSVQLKYDL